eukprot:g3080.t1
MSSYPVYTLALLTLTYLCNFVARSLLSILADEVKRDLTLTDAQLGFVYGTMFSLSYSLFSVPLGRVSDKWRRTYMIVLSALIWGSTTSLTVFAASLWSLALCRALVGFGQAGASPAAFALLADLFPPQQRGLVFAIYACGAAAGSGLSLLLGGQIAGAWPPGLIGLRPWQASFFFLGLP